MAIGDPVTNEVFIWVIMIFLNYMLVMNYGKAKGLRRLMGAFFMIPILMLSYMVIDISTPQLGDWNLFGLVFTIMGWIYFFIQLKVYIDKEIKTP